MATKLKIKPPAGLGEAGKALWRDVVAVYTLRPDEKRILTDACMAADRVATMREELDARSIVTAGSMGQEVVHPLVAEIRAHEAQIAGLLAKLKLPDAPTGAATPNQNRAAGQSRWASAHGAGA